ncbi:unnamed protein product [Rotaria sordida]|uniref:EGF-like domain-containing protein n=1 Tax=Rotaria sordida TaxID=392033 RepID=A0A815PKM9_9BILA|nr:unnamed protein product [Rotaria sordida]CAF1450667.1 unnamed protein product [Rotaria sordida]
MVQWLMIILVYDFTILKLSLSEVTLSLRLLHYKNPNGLTYENRQCDTRHEHDINRDGRCDTAFLFCLVRLPFQNPHNCTLGDHFTGIVGANDIHFIDIDQQQQDKLDTQQRSMSLVSIWFQPTIHFRFNYPKTGIGIIVEVFDIDDINNRTNHDSIDFYGRTLLDLKIYRSEELAQKQRIYLRSLFGTHTNLTADLSLYCSPNSYGNYCEIFCIPNEQRYDCDLNTGQKICKHGYFGQDCLSDVRACEDQPCLNNGTCVVYLRSYLCRCQKGYTGRSCEIGPAGKMTEYKCNRINCVHGNCLKNGKCLCHDGWISDNCNQSSIIKESGCISRPCLHNSTCETLIGVNPVSAYRCHCRIGYTGRNCEVAMVISCERTQCVHGQCFKIDFYTEICVCEKNWGGFDCSEPLSISSTTQKSYRLTTLTSAKFIHTTKSIKKIKNITNISLKNDLRDYLNWLNTNYGITKTTKLFQLPTTTPISAHKYKYTPCLSTPCLHNSTCIVKSEYTFQCRCLPSFIGTYCEIEQNPCESSPCQHQSVCVTKSNRTIHCICRSHYTGKFCEYPVPFPLLPFNQKCTRTCYHGGICLIDEANREQCICTSSYTGLYCELSKINCSISNDPLCNIDPCLSNPCLSNGTCYLLSPIKNYTCSCLEQYTGERCELEINSDLTNILSRDNNFNPDENNNTADLWPLAIVFGYIFSLMLVFIIIWFLWYGLTIRPQSYVPYGERVSDRYQPYRLGVSNPLFFTNQEYNTPISKPWSTPVTTISNLDQWTRTITR